MNSTHIRYREIPVRQCSKDCPADNSDILKVIIFKSDRKFRAHAVKHCLNLNEISWSGILDIKKECISKCIYELEHLGCPDTSEPPCQNCPVYSSCTAIVRELETTYLDAVEKLIGEGGMLPRYACFYSTRENNDAVWAVPDRRFVVKTSSLSGGIYNVSTCYNPAEKKMGQIILSQQETIRKEADTGRGIVWCDEDTWNIRESEKNPINRKSPGKKKKKGKKLLPHRRGGGNNYRKYLDDYSDDNDR